ncbi:hypothetical protein LguiA_032796 [Lonicera macranthoides]
MSKPWGGGIGAWAAEAERAEAEEKEEAAAAAAAAARSVGGDSQSFPSLRDAVSTKQKKKTKMSLQEFTMQGAFPAAGGGAGRRGLTPDEMLRLPTGPKERSPDEMQFGGRLGGGFSSYGRSSGPPRRDRDGDGDNSWGANRRSYGGFDDDNRRAPPPRVSDYDQPSRADEVDNWAMTKKPMVPFDSGRPNNKYSALGLGGGVGGGGGISRADEVDNWAVGKKPVAIAPRSSSFGSGFRDSGPEPDRWSRGGGDGGQERRRLVLDPPRSEMAVFEPVKTNKPNPFGAARPREEILAEKGFDWKKVDMELEGKKTSRPTSSQSSRPGSSQSIRSEGLTLQGGIEGAVKPRPKVNPFGDAKPREVLLEEKGLDWKKIDLELEHRRVERPETEAEKNLKEEIDQMKRELEKESASNTTNREPVEGSGEDQTNLHDLLLNKEKDLELLIRELDDKVRFGQKAIERPGSGAGRVAERPSSRAGSVENVEYMERPQSRGGTTGGDSWGRQGDDRRGFLGGRERGFLGNRELDRQRSRDRW